jgi:hypothetical protein
MPLWQELAAPDASLMAGCEGYNYGVVANDTFCILDIDNPEAFHNELGVKLPATYTVATSRGKHLYFRHTDKSRRLGNRSAIGVFDFQADAKYVVGEGSTHPSGHIYSCIDPSPIIEIPDSLVDVLERFVVQRRRERARLGLKAGDREDMLNYAGTIFTAEITEEEMLEKLLERNETHSEEPLSLGDLQRMVQSAFKRWEPAELSPKVVVGKPELAGPSTDGGSFQYLLGPRSNDKHGIFGTRRVNAIFGASAAGKTTIALQMLEAQSAKKTFLEREGAGWPYLVIWQDRGKADLEEQLHNLGLVGVPKEFHVVTEAERDMGPAKAIEHIYLGRQERPRVVFVEGVDLWLEDACDSKDISNQIHQVRAVAEHYDLSLIVSLGAPKSKAKEGYVAARDRIIGSSTWGRVLSTLLEVKMQEDTNRRLVSILPRADKNQTIQMEMVEGRLVEYHGIEVQISGGNMGSKKDAVFAYLNQHPDATTVMLAKAFAPMGESTARRWMQRWESEGAGNAHLALSDRAGERAQ